MSAQQGWNAEPVTGRGTVSAVAGTKYEWVAKNPLTPRWFDRLLVGMVFVTILAPTVPMLWGWYPTLGPSMEPTLPYIGGYIGCEQLASPATQLRVGDIVRLKGRTLGYAVKRVAKIDSAQGVYVLGDNTNMSADSSFGVDQDDPDREVWIPFSEVKGRATAIWSPLSAWRALSVNGRWQNTIDFKTPPQNLQPSPDKRYMAVMRDDGVDILRLGSLQPVLKLDGKFYSWEDGESFQFITPSPELRLVRIDGTAKSLAKPPESIGFAGSGQSELVFDGDTVVHIGDTLEIPSQCAVVKVVGIRKFVCGVPGGIATSVKIDRPLSRQPEMGDKVIPRSVQ